ncbi:UDP:flavonoid glycosyltransferase YjiC (YdhE family) [Catenuloplanes nepalensis]|uniref:UDP:flavonoid glycosyltransferase YjiC (YdhE family) n=1 Tax=Catenuloplanes nepalensis TaxID=587533 RepID=A0ABT9N664_9ACTN|nr:glycosyltransferase [Catenuloplanes nepalensis]MDP9799035.1 UDP:flavonoid glycosyltransferase YjiC (YdhE family) [Catenuloplanes nepalensis]
MRVLFSFIGGYGHFLPLVPIARAVQAAGHAVAVLGGPRMAGVIRDAGFEALPAGGQPHLPAQPRTTHPPAQPRAGHAPTVPGAGHAPTVPGAGHTPTVPGAGHTPVEAGAVRGPLAPLDLARERREITEQFIRGSGRERAARLLEVAGEWRPDLIVCDEVNVGAMIAAERLGIPHATVVVLVAGSFLQDGYTAEAVDEVRAEFGLPPDNGLAMLGRHLMLEPAPPGFRDPAFPLPPTARAIRPSATLPAPAERNERPLIYFTLGTAFNAESGDLFERMLTGLRELPADLVMTVGRHIDPAVFGPQPPHVRIERFVPQDELLHRCDLVISHGGSGSVLGAITHGLPMLVAPLGADQPDNGARVAALGLGRVLDAETVTPEQAATAAAAVLADGGHRAVARALRTAWESLPGPDEAVAMLEGIV